MCYYLDSPIFNGKTNNDTINNIFEIFIKNNRDKALQILSNKYNVSINDIIPDKYKDLRDNF